MTHPPTPPASCNDCGRCETCQESDDYGTAWRNPAFLPPLAPDRPEDVHGPALTRDGFTAALTALGRDGGEPDRCGRGSCCLLDGHAGRCER